MRIQVAVPEAHVSKPVLDGALEAVTRLNESMLRKGDTPTSDQLIASGARWKPEPPGQEHFDHGGVIAARGHGDCDDWAPLHAATLRVTGEDPGATAVVRRSGPQRWHAIVRRSDGTIDDPSLAAGMPGPRNVGIIGAWLPPMHRRVSGVDGTFIAQPHLALRPVHDRQGQVEAWQARADLPWHWRSSTASPDDVAMVSLHQSPVSDQAVVGAVRGAWRLGVESGNAHPDHLRRLAAIADACEGCPWEEIAERYGPEHATAAGVVVGGFFSKIVKIAKKAANPFDLAKSVVKAVPGVGPIAARGLGKIMPTTANLIKYGPMAAKFVPGIGPLAGPLASKALAMASPALKRSVARAQHAPPQMRAAIRARTPVRRASPGVARSSAAPQIIRPVVVTPQIIRPVVINPSVSASPASPGVAWPPRG